MQPESLKNLDLNDLKLADLSDLEDNKIKEKLTEHLRYIKLDRNHLIDIDFLNNFERLKRISAVTNYISSVNLQLKDL